MKTPQIKTLRSLNPSPRNVKNQKEHGYCFQKRFTYRRVKTPTRESIGIRTQERFQALVSFQKRLPLLGCLKQNKAFAGLSFLINQTQKPNFNQKLEVSMKLLETQIAFVHYVRLFGATVSCKQNVRYYVYSATMQ